MKTKSQCPYRAEHEYDEEGLCRHCYAARVQAKTDGKLVALDVPDIVKPDIWTGTEVGKFYSIPVVLQSPSWQGTISSGGNSLNGGIVTINGTINGQGMWQGQQQWVGQNAGGLAAQQHQGQLNALNQQIDAQMQQAFGQALVNLQPWQQELLKGVQFCQPVDQALLQKQKFKPRHINQYAQLSFAQAELASAQLMGAPIDRLQMLSTRVAALEDELKEFTREAEMKRESERQAHVAIEAKRRACVHDTLVVTPTAGGNVGDCTACGKTFDDEDIETLKRDRAAMQSVEVKAKGVHPQAIIQAIHKEWDELNSEFWNHAAQPYSRICPKCSFVVRAGVEHDCFKRGVDGS